MKYNPTPLSSAALSAASETPATEYLFTAAINLIQYDAAGTGTNLGARGMTLLSQPTSRSYHLVCYETATQKQDCSVSINGNFKLSLLPGGHYCAFFDEKQQYWCTQFSSEEQVSNFAQTVACVNHAQLRQNAPESTPLPLIMQDLVPDPAPEAKPLANGDSVKVKYTMHLLSPSHPKNPLLGTIVGSVTQPKLVKLGAGKELKGLEVGMLGMKKAQSRLLLIPPEQGYGPTAAGAIPANSTLLVLVTVTAAKYAGEKKSKTEEEPAETSAFTTTAALPAATPMSSQAPPANTSDDDPKNSLLTRIAQQSGGFSMAHLAGMKPNSSPNIQQPTPSLTPTPLPLNPPSSAAATTNALYNPLSQYGSPEQILQMQQQFQQQQQQQLLQQLGIFGVAPAGLPGLGAGLGGIPSTVPPGVPGGVPGGFSSLANSSQHHHSAPSVPAGPSVSDQKQIGLLESMAKRIDNIHASLSGSAELTEGLEGALSGYEVVRALQNSLKDRERTKAAMEANKKKMAQMQDKIDELRSASDMSRTETASSWEKRMEAFQEDARQRQALIADLTREKKELQASLMQKSQELSDVAFKLNLAQTDLDRSMASGGNVQELQKQAVEAKAELSSVKASLAALASEKAAQLSDLRQAHAAEIASLQAQHQDALATLNNKLGGEVQNEQKKAGEASLALTAKANLLQGQVEDLTSQLDQHRAQISDLTLQLGSQQAQVSELTDLLKQQQEINHALQAKEEAERTARITAEEALTTANAKISAAPPPVAEDDLKVRLQAEFEAGRVAGFEAGKAEGAQRARESSSHTLARESESSQALMNGLKETISNLEQKLREVGSEKEDVVMQSKAVIKKLREQLNHTKETGDPDNVLGALFELLSQALDEAESYEGAKILTLIKKAMRRVGNQIRAEMEKTPALIVERESVSAVAAEPSNLEPSVSEADNTPGAIEVTMPVVVARTPTSAESASEVHTQTLASEPLAGFLSIPSSLPQPSNEQEPQVTEAVSSPMLLDVARESSEAAKLFEEPEVVSQQVDAVTLLAGEVQGESEDSFIPSKSPILESEQPGLYPVNIVMPPSEQFDAEGVQ